MRRARSSMRLALCAAALFAALPCAGGDLEFDTLRISVPLSVSSLPVLELAGTEVDGCVVKTSVYQDHSIVLADFIRGNVDVLMTGFTQGAAVFSGNPNIRLLVTPVWGVSSLMVRDGALKGIGDLSGKTVVVPFAKSPLDLQLRALLGRAGVLDRVTIQYGPTPQAIPLLLAGKVDAIAVPEPFGSQLEAQGKAYRLFVFQTEWALLAGGDPRTPQASLFVMKAFADSHSSLLDALVGAVAGKIGYLKANLQAVAVRYTPAFNMEQNILVKGIENTLFDVPRFAEAAVRTDDYLARIGLEKIDSGFYLSY